MKKKLENCDLKYKYDAKGFLVQIIKEQSIVKIFHLSTSLSKILT